MLRFLYCCLAYNWNFYVRYFSAISDICFVCFVSFSFVSDFKVYFNIIIKQRRFLKKKKNLNSTFVI